jgi:hypothetical protein
MVGELKKMDSQQIYPEENIKPEEEMAQVDGEK